MNILPNMQNALAYAAEAPMQRFLRAVHEQLGVNLAMVHEWSNRKYFLKDVKDGTVVLAFDEDELGAAGHTDAFMHSLIPRIRAYAESRPVVAHLNTYRAKAAERDLDHILASLALMNNEEKQQEGGNDEDKQDNTQRG